MDGLAAIVYIDFAQKSIGKLFSVESKYYPRAELVHNFSTFVVELITLLTAMW
jgi:hypothetical protein